ncbi:hypothetical protein OCK74_23700 [Chitinophagaceae bacterium LB-8]|uniref:Uncharacterized protein n=1 Tax=Paraflavisolibacter caeni TaxID=2982496 RepID=A0A9X3BHB8_9BACT|nr:hypothetical protein [Paraflavisolibacter caeni]MCU7552144.1 hypothetical protein [Paraflavisolibacter caeni]
MKRFLLYTLLFLLAQPLFATSIVILVTPYYVVMGTDSRRTILDGNANVSEKVSVCKINRVRNYCYALAGMVASRNTFSAHKIINKELKRAKDYNQAVSRIKQEIKKALHNEFMYQKLFQPELYKKSVASKRNILEVALVSIKDNKPQVQIIGFEFTDENEIDVKDYTEKCPGDCPPQQSQFYFLGDYSGIEKYFDTKPKVSDPVSFVEQLIRIQSQTTPSSVAAPINIVKFSSNGVEWIK